MNFLVEESQKVQNIVIDENYTLSEDLTTYGSLILEGGTLDLNGHTLRIPKLNFFNKNATVKDSSEGKGKIILKSEKTENVDRVIYELGKFAMDDEALTAIAGKELYGEAE